MQIDIKDYNPEIHDRYRAITIRQPFADRLARGEKCIEIRNKMTNYRGELLVCSAKAPIIEGRESGCTLGLVELYDVKPVSEFTEEDWANANISEDEIGKRKGYGWMMRNARRVIEMPVKGQLGIYYLAVPKGDITEYPEALHIDARDWRIIKAKANGAEI